jgi:alpha-beta hydrolase superfamily lysophospholipase
MPGCQRTTEKLFCWDCWQKIPADLRSEFLQQTDKGMKREAYRKLSDWCAANHSTRVLPAAQL